MEGTNKSTTVLDDFIHSNIIDGAVFFHFIDKKDWVSILCSWYSPKYPHCSLLFMSDDGKIFNCNLTWKGFLISYFNPLTPGDIILFSDIGINNDTVPIAFIKLLMLRVSCIRDLVPNVFTFLRYPFVSKKPFVCTSFVQHCLYLPITGETPKQFYEQLTKKE